MGYFRGKAGGFERERGGVTIFQNAETYFGVNHCSKLALPSKISNIKDEVLKALWARRRIEEARPARPDSGVMAVGPGLSAEPLRLGGVTTGAGVSGGRAGSLSAARSPVSCDGFSKASRLPKFRAAGAPAAPGALQTG
eukprot:768120-Hanusia_phi.AAC.1